VAVHFRLKSQFAELTRLAEEITRLGTEHHLPDEVIFHLNLALEEVVSNIIRHGYGGREDGEVSLVLHLAGEAIAVTVEDDGVPFNPLELPDPDLTAPLEEREVGGLGVYLVRQLMDEVDYRAEGGRNILRMTIRLAPRRPRTGTAGPDE
jgi:anti-sigma regulatory factor (Ser/Thr protein kinase)